MATLLLRLVAPMQSWGTRGQLRYRHTDLEPSKSGVLGLICAALGRDRNDPIDDLAALRMGVRVEREGVVMEDFQTAMNCRCADGSSLGSVVVRRFYLSDAVFLVGLEGDDKQLLAQIHMALRNPKHTVYLGRKGCPPSEPVWLKDGLRDESLEEALASFKPLVSQNSYRYVIELPRGRAHHAGIIYEVRMDQPLGPFSQRCFGERYVWVVTARKGERLKCTSRS